MRGREICQRLRTYSVWAVQHFNRRVILYLGSTLRRSTKQRATPGALAW